MNEQLFDRTLIKYNFQYSGQNDGGLYAIRDPHTINALPIRITATKKGWFYHRAVHVKLPTGEEGILTARANKPLLGRGKGELVWLSLPPDLDSCFPTASTISDTYSADSFPVLETEVLQEMTQKIRHTTMNKKAIEIAITPTPPPPKVISSSTPWTEVILAEGPDVMFEVLDLDSSDDCLEVISAHFFGQKLSVHSIKAIPTAPYIEISAMKTLDTIGRPYGLCLATMTPTPSKPKDSREIPSSILPDYSSCDNSEPTHLLVSTHECSYDFPSAYNMALSALGGIYPSIITGAAFAFRNGQQSVRPGVEDIGDVRGGSLFSYEIPRTNKKMNKQAISNRIGVSNVLNAPPINSPALERKRSLDDMAQSFTLNEVSNPEHISSLEKRNSIDRIESENKNGESNFENSLSTVSVPPIYGARSERSVTIVHHAHHFQHPLLCCTDVLRILPFLLLVLHSIGRDKRCSAASRCVVGAAYSVRVRPASRTYSECRTNHRYALQS